MNNTYILLVLVNILTKAEKRYFHLYANLQNGDQIIIGKTKCERYKNEMR